MSPANIEAKIKSASPLVAQVVAIGDYRPYNVALITLDPDACGACAAKHGLEDASPAAMARDDVVARPIAAGVEQANAKLSRVEQIKKFKLIEAEWPGRRRADADDEAQAQADRREVRQEIEALYAALIAADPQRGGSPAFPLRRAACIAPSHRGAGPGAAATQRRAAAPSRARS